MEEIYRNNGSGWVKIGVVRDPVTRLLSAYLDFTRKWLAAGTACPSSREYSPSKDFSEALQAMKCGGDENVSGIPTLAEVVEVLHHHMWTSPTAFHPISSLCGAKFSQFDGIILFEDLQVRARDFARIVRDEGFVVGVSASLSVVH